MPADTLAYTLLIDGAPAPPELVAAVQSVQVEDHAELADVLRLRLTVGVREDGGGWTVLDDDVFSRLRNLRLAVQVGNAAEPLIDGYVIETAATFAADPGQSVLTVVAMDATVLMHLEEKVRAWPDMTDSDVATTVFGEYGFAAEVQDTGRARADADHRTIQRGTDIQFLEHLARRNGYECYLEVDPVTGRTAGHFHPPRADQPPQGVLTVNMGQATNVSAFQARYDMLRATTAQATGLDVSTREDQPADVREQQGAGLGKGAAVKADRPRKVLLGGTGLSAAGDLQTLAQAVVERSAWAVFAEGELNAAVYGGVLRAKRPVLVRGAGRTFSGTYYVERVLHTFAGGTYTQKFSLRRNALGVTGREAFAGDAR